MRVAELVAIVERGRPGRETMRAIFELVRLGAVEAVPSLRRSASQLPENPSAIARASAFLLAGEIAPLVDEIMANQVMAHTSPQPFFHLSRLPIGCERLFTAWLSVLRRDSASSGVTAFRSFLGDVSEAAFRALCLTNDATALLGEEAIGWLSDTICAELPGTTDFLAARGMTWLLGAIQRDDDAARAAIERARSRFRDGTFQIDCDAILGAGKWPPIAAATDI